MSYARIATWENVADPSRAQEVSDTLRSIGLETIKDLNGWEGIVSMVDEENRRVTTVSFFDSEDNARAADEPMRNISFDRVPDDVRQLMQQSGPPTITFAKVLNREGM